METRPILNRDYKFGERIVRFIGRATHSKEYMLRDIHSGTFVFVKPGDLNKLKEE